MQNDPPFNNEPDGTPPVAGNEQENSTLHQPSNTSITPEYKEFVQPAAQAASSQQQAAPIARPLPGAQAPGAPSTVSQSRSVAQRVYMPPTPQPGYVPSTPQPGYVPVSQPGYVPSMPQPGYVPAPQPGYVAQPGYVPATPQPGYVPPPGMPPQFPQQPGPRNKWTGLTIAGVVVAVVVLLAVLLGSISLARQGGNSPANTPVATAPRISSTPTAGPGQSTSAFQTAPCPFTVGSGIVEGQQLTCGYVTVPQNREVNNGLKVKLAVAVFKAPQYMNSTDPDPVLRLDGGPGGPSLSGWAAAITSANYHQFVFNHNLIMFDQRGTGYSTPALNCQELLSLQDATVGDVQDYEQATHACYNRLTSLGIDLNGFNSLQNAADVADIIHALGYKQMTLYGVSYGTRLALTVMRLYPSVVHATVLDSVYPPTHKDDDLTLSAQRVFNVLFQGCAKDANCNAKYPNLQSVFYSLVDQLNAKPITFDTVDLNNNMPHTVHFAGDDLISWVFSTLYVTQLIPVIPQVIFQVKAHDYKELSTIYGAIVFDDTFSQGLFYSTQCSENGPFMTEQSIAQSEQGVDPHLVKVFGKDDEQEEYDICQFWKVKPVPAAQKQPVTSSIPTLVVTGEYDPITPPANGQGAAKTLSHSYFFEFPGQGHGQLYSSACSDQIISAFYDNPAVKPDGSCISQMSGPQFV